MKKIFYSMLLTILLITPFSVKADADVDSNGSAITGGTTIATNTELRISNANDYGIRITVVDENGNRKSARTADYWPTSFPSFNIKQMPGSSWKTDIVNKGGLSYSKLDSFENYSYGVNSSGQLLYDASHISGAGTGTWSTKHVTLENLIDRAVNDEKTCKNPDFLNDVGFDICRYVENNECEELKKMYVLIEPLVRMHDGGVYYVFSGTEAANYFPAALAANDIEETDYKNNFGGSVYRNLINMYLTNQEDDSLKYRLKSNGAVYAYFTSKPTSSNAGNESSDRLNLFAGKTHDSNGNPWGSSMQIVWLGKAAKECKPSECCVPCDPEDQACIEAAGDNWHQDDPYCCYETGEISKDGTMEACVPADEYWKDEDNQVLYDQHCAPCCIPTESNNFCCDATDELICDGDSKKDYYEYWSDKQDLYNQRCKTPDGCSTPNLEPEIVLGYCTVDDSANMSYFRDPVFSSDGTLTSLGLQTYEKVTDAKLILGGNGEIKDSILEAIAEPDMKDNSFQAVAANFDANYSEVINDYCNLHCQEVFDVTLPSNYPVAQAGRYFRWTVDEPWTMGSTETIITKASGAKFCAVDIDLDKAIDVYLDASEDARLAGENERIFNSVYNWDYFVGVGAEGASFTDCEDYKNQYESFPDGDHAKFFGGIHQNTWYGPSLNFIEWVDCGKDENGRTIWGPHYEVEFQGQGTYGIDRVYTGLPVYVSGDYECYTPSSITNPRYLDKRPTDEIGKTLPAGYYHPQAWCDAVLEDYQKYIVGFTNTVNNLHKQIKACSVMGEIVLDMGVEMKYQTLFDEYSYSTNDGEIYYSDSSVEYEGDKCIANTAPCYSDRNKDGYDDTYFYMDPYTRKMESESLRCDRTVGSWGFEDKYPSANTVRNPNIQFGMSYSPNDLKMLDFNEFAITSKAADATGWFPDKTDIKYKESDGTNYWNTIYASIVGAENVYELLETINACVCKDGEIRDSENGSCLCERKVSYTEFTESYNNYQALPDGTLTVEFMNGSGLYPIDLRYWTIGSVDDEEIGVNTSGGNGHFDYLLDEKTDGQCNESEGCIYGDPYGVCRFAIVNRIIAEPDDVVDCEEEPCDDDDDGDDDDGGDCEEEPCDDDDDDFDDIGRCENPPCEDDCIIDGQPDPSCKNVAGLNVIYRVVDLVEPFHTPDGDTRNPGANWQGNEEIITNNRGVSGMQVYSLDPLYSITLTPAAIKEIRKDNAENMDGDYLKGTLIYPDSDIIGSEVIGGGYSLFVHHVLGNIAKNYGGNFEIKTDKDDRFDDINNNSLG